MWAWLKSLSEALWNLSHTAEERRRWNELRQRPLLDDEAFIERFYPNPETPRHIPIRLRRVYVKQLGMGQVWPRDQATDFEGESDYADLLYKVEDEFGVKLPRPRDFVKQYGLTFDGIVRCLTDQRRLATVR